jgi:hypothetical protein
MKTRKNTVICGIFAILAVFGLVLAGCGGGSTPGDSGNTVTKITVTNAPTKTEYAIGDTIDLTGMTVTVVYKDGSTGTLTITAGNISGFDSSTAGNKTVTVTYGGKTATFTVNVLSAGTTLVSIAVTTPPTKTQYNMGEDLDLTGMVVTASYSDGSTAAVTSYTTDTSGYDKTTAGNHTITVTYNDKTAELIVNVIDPNLETVATPTASPEAGNFNEAQTVTLSCTTDGATIYYTIDGSNPTITSTLYSSAISIEVTTTVKAIAFKENMNDSGILTAVYALRPVTPTATPIAGTFKEAQSVTLSCTTENTTIYYTTDGSTPSNSSTEYTAPITIGLTSTLKAVAVKEGWSNSEMLIAEYTINILSAPELTLMAKNQSIQYSWTASNPAADSYDVYWKEGSGLTAETVKTGTKITGATSGGTITALTNGTAYSVLVTANKADFNSVDSAVKTATPDQVKITVTGNTLAEKLAWIKNNAISDRMYIVDVVADESISPQDLSYSGKDTITIQLKGIGESARTVSLSSYDYGLLFSIGNGVTLVLDDNLILSGRSNNNNSLVRVNTSGIFIMKGGSISGNTASTYTSSPSSYAYGGGVYVAGNGTFTMEGGEISGNTASTSTSSPSSYAYSYGGGVYVAGNGTFTMEGGKISGNKASTSGSNSYANSYGGGVYVAGNGTFTMEGGEISGNTASASGSYAYSYGCGVYVGENGTFTMEGGEISGNTAYSTSNRNDSANSYGSGVYVAGTFTMEGGEISDNTVYGSGYNNKIYGGGVYVAYNGNFTMSSGEISSNRISSSDINFSYGGGVYVAGTFTMEDGKISGNTASGSGTSYGGGVYVAGTFTMIGGEISGNTVSTSAGYNPNSYGGGVYVAGGNGINFTKIGGTIYGYSTSDSVNSNKVNDNVSNRGHAVYVRISQHRETTAGPEVNLDSSKSGAEGGWEN